MRLIGSRCKAGRVGDRGRHCSTRELGVGEKVSVCKGPFSACFRVLFLLCFQPFGQSSQCLFLMCPQSLLKVISVVVLFYGRMMNILNY